MTRRVSSYVVGSWFTADEDGAVVRDASTGEPVAEVSSGGIDFDRMLDHARQVGGPALRSLTFHERAGLLKKLSAYLSDHTAPIYAEYPTSGATQADARVDVEGGLQVLSVYAKKGVTELPNDTLYLDGVPQDLSQGRTFMGQTVYSSRRGVAVLVNAYNFPVWAMLEKLAPAVLAGMPVIIKPATVTAHLAEIAFRQIVESGILPTGSIQLIAGSLGNLLDRLEGQDFISFTGSAQTAATLRGSASIVERGTRFNAEADSLNACILGPDAGLVTEEFTLFIKAVTRELISKSGQKCTAIRRVMVPRDTVGEVVEALRTQLGKVVIGDPRIEGTTMGPLVSGSALGDVETAVSSLMNAADVAIGGSDDPPKLSSGDVSSGAFFPPTVLVAKDIWSPELHQVEPFGPVATIFGYQTPEEAVELVALGAGSLVASVASNDADFVRRVVRGIAPFHGRLLVINRDTAKSATPHGAALPELIHGGPGRAGGGEELGGIRAVLRMMQVTSVTGPAQMLVSITDTWNSAAQPRLPQVHPFRLHLEELEVGDTLFTKSRLITLEDIEHFAEFTGDTFYAHMDEEAAKASPLFEGRVAHGYFVIAAAAGLFVDPEPGPVLANFGLDRLRFVKPVYPGDEIKLRLTCKHKAVRPGAGWGEVTWDVEVTNQKDETVATYDLLTINAGKNAA